jgi:predicted secreted Zn-dependent protease
MQFCWHMAATAALLLSTLLPARGEVVSSTEVSYFDVVGSTPAEIYRNILDRGPRIGGNKALASIGTRTVQDGRIAQIGDSCVLKDYTITLQFVIRRPRIANEDVLSDADRALWRDMNAFIQTHENEHKDVWSACAVELDNRMSALKLPSCDELAETADGLWRKMLADCDARQRSYDIEQARQLMRQPFMQRAREGAGER